MRSAAPDDDRARCDVLAGGAHVGAGHDDVPDEDAVRVGGDLLHGHHGVPVAVDRLPRVDRGVLAGPQHDRRERRGRGLHRDPVHRRAAVRRVGVQRHDVRRRDAAERLADRDPLGRRRLEGAGAAEQLDPLGQRDLGRGIVTWRDHAVAIVATGAALRSRRERRARPIVSELLALFTPLELESDLALAATPPA